MVQIVKEPISTKGPRLTGDYILCRTLYCTNPNSSDNVKWFTTKNKKMEEERASVKATYTKHSPKKFWGNCSYSCAREKELQNSMQR